MPSRRSLWAWLTLRMVALAVAATAAVQVGMWIRYEIWSDRINSQLPPEIAAELGRLEDAPKENTKRLHEIYTQYSDLFVSPTDTEDLLVQALLSLAIIPFVVVFALILARRIAQPLSHVVVAAESVSVGQFSTRAPVPKTAPAELQRLATHFNKMAQQLESYDRELHDSSAAIAHELRTPLTAAMGRLQGIMDQVFPLEEAQIATVLDQLVQIQHIIGDLQVLSLVQGDRLQLEITEFAVREFVDERISWAGPALRKCGLQAVNHVDPVQTLRGDRSRLGQVLSALIDNVVRHASDGGIVEVDFEAGDLSVELIVRDRGASILPDDKDLSRFFERFWRGEKSRSRHAGGTGLGLSVVHAICKAHGGHATAAARAGGGTEIRVRLPRAGMAASTGKQTI